MSFGIYLFGYIVLIAGLSFGANLIHVPPQWIGVGAVCLARNRHSPRCDRDPAKGSAGARVALHAEVAMTGSKLVVFGTIAAISGGRDRLRESLGNRAFRSRARRSTPSRTSEARRDRRPGEPPVRRADRRSLGSPWRLPDRGRHRLVRRSRPAVAGVRRRQQRRDFAGNHRRRPPGCDRRPESRRVRDDGRADRDGSRWPQRRRDADAPARDESGLRAEQVAAASHEPGGRESARDSRAAGDQPLRARARARQPDTEEEPHASRARRGSCVRARAGDRLRRVPDDAQRACQPPGADDGRLGRDTRAGRAPAAGDGPAAEGHGPPAPTRPGLRGHHEGSPDQRGERGRRGGSS